MKYILATIMIMVMSGCASTMAPEIGTQGKMQDETLNHNKVDLLTLFRVDYHTGDRVINTGVPGVLR